MCCFGCLMLRESDLDRQKTLFPWTLSGQWKKWLRILALVLSTAVSVSFACVEDFAVSASFADITRQVMHGVFHVHLHIKPTYNLEASGTGRAASSSGWNNSEHCFPRHGSEASQALPKRTLHFSTTNHPSSNSRRPITKPSKRSQTHQLKKQPCNPTAKTAGSTM